MRRASKIRTKNDYAGSYTNPAQRGEVCNILWCAKLGHFIFNWTPLKKLDWASLKIVLRIAKISEHDLVTVSKSLSLFFFPAQ